MFTIGETRPNCDGNELQDSDAEGTRQIRPGRLNNETQREKRRRRHQETTEQRQKTTSLRIICPPSPSFARFCESRISSINYVCLRITWIEMDGNLKKKIALLVYFRKVAKNDYS